MSKSAIIRFRCEEDLKQRFEKIAEVERRDPADLSRIIYEDYIRLKEKQLLEQTVLNETTGATTPRTARHISYGPARSGRTSRPAAQKPVVIGLEAVDEELARQRREQAAPASPSPKSRSRAGIQTPKKKFPA